MNTILLIYVTPPDTFQRIVAACWYGAEAGVERTQENGRRTRYLINSIYNTRCFKITFTETWILVHWREEESTTAYKASDPSVVDYTTEVGASCTVTFGRKQYVGMVAATGKK